LPTSAFAQGAPASADAMAFIRVIGDFRAEYKRVWKLPLERRDLEIATGSGFVIAPGGLILTNHHVIAGRSFVQPIEGEPAEITMDVTRIEAVVGAGESRLVLPAALVAADPELDLAVLSVTAGELPYVPFGDSEAVDAGQPAQVLGFPHGRRVEVAKPEGAGVVPSVTVSAGHVSASRSDAAGEQRYLQTDASVQPGNSGGPMLDGEGYALGVVRSKLAGAQGAGFAIPINHVKDFLEANGYLPQLPARRLRLSAPQPYDWKGLRLRLPDHLDDASASRLRLGGGALLEEGQLLVDRIFTSWSLGQLEEALLAGAFDGAPLTPRASAATAGERSPRRVRAGSATTGREGEALRVEYALFDLGKEKLCARFLAPPPQVAFNLSVVQGALRSLEPERLLTNELAAPLAVEWNAVPLRDPRAPAVPLPAGFVIDETPSPTCPRLAPPDSLLSASPRGDFSVAFRVSFWAQGEVPDDCPGEASYSLFGVGYESRSAFATSDAGLLRFEISAPATKWPHVEAAALAWLERAGRPAPRPP
jgi:hypothetical protein